MWFPSWPLQRLRNERPELRRSELVLFAGHNQRLLVTVCGPKAQRLGVREGQPLAEAKAAFRKAVYIPADVVADREALCQLVLDGQQFSPLVGVEEGTCPKRCSATSPAARTCGMARSGFSGRFATTGASAFQNTAALAGTVEQRGRSARREDRRGSRRR